MIYSRAKRTFASVIFLKASLLPDFAARSIRSFDPRWAFFGSLPDNGRILDLGCGRGDNCLALRSVRPPWEIYGIDLLFASEVPEFVKYVQFDLNNRPLPYPDAHFDAILLIHVIEHLQNPLSLCSEIRRLLRPGGRVYIETPNYTTLFVPSFGLKRSQHHPFNFFDDLGHQKPYSKQALYEFIENCGLQVSKLGNTRNWLRIPIDLLGLPWNLIKGDRRRAVGHFWNLYGWCIYGVGQKC